MGQCGFRLGGIGLQNKGTGWSMVEGECNAAMHARSHTHTHTRARVENRKTRRAVGEDSSGAAEQH